MPAHYTYVAAQVYVWMQSYERRSLTLEAHFKEVFGAIKAAGISEVEGWLHWFDKTAYAERLALILQEKQMRLPSVYCNARLHDSAVVDTSINDVRRLALRACSASCHRIVLNPEPVDWGSPTPKTDLQLQVQADALNTLGEMLAQMGMQLAVHHHDAEMRDGAREFYHVLEHTQPGTVGICLDIDWVLRGGQSPLRLIQEVGTRLVHIHLRNSAGGRWIEALGPGDIDYPAIHAALDQLTYTGPLIIELAYEAHRLPAENIGENLKLSYEYVQAVFGV